MKHVFQKDLTVFFAGIHGFIIVALFALFANFLFFKDVFLYGAASMRAFFDVVPWLLMIYIPVVTMRSFAQERQSGTLEILQTLPLRAQCVVLGKIAAGVVICMLGVALTCIIPIILRILVGSNFALPDVFVGYVGILLYTTLFVAIGVFLSMQTSNQALAFLLLALTMFCMNSLATEFFSTVVPGLLQQFLYVLSPVFHLTTFVKGVIDFRSVFYFLSLTGIFFWLTVLDFRKK